VGYFRDTKEHKKMEKEIKVSEEKYRTLAENAMIAIYIISTKSGFEYINPAFEKIFGYKSEEIYHKGFSLLDLVYPDDRKLIENRMVAQEKGKELSSVYRFRGITKEGYIKHVEVNTVAFPGKENKVLGILRDIMEQKKAEIRLGEFESDLRKQELALEQKNIALREVIAQVEMEKRRIENNIDNNLKAVIFPILKKLEKEKANLGIANLLQHHLEKLSSSYGKKITNIKFKLTNREIEICNMVKAGLTSKEISNLLYISYKTVEKHRANIRHKLEISNSHINLVSFLREM